MAKELNMGGGKEKLYGEETWQTQHLRDQGWHQHTSHVDIMYR